MFFRLFIRYTGSIKCELMIYFKKNCLLQLKLNNHLTDILLILILDLPIVKSF